MTSKEPPLQADIWAAIKDARDEAVALGRPLYAARLTNLLQRMKVAGMASHLPTIEAVREAWGDG